MSRPQRTSGWGIPWLGLPLAGLLSLAVAVQIGWHSAALDEAEGQPSDLSVDAPAVPAGAPAEPMRAPDRSAALRPGQTLGAVLLDLGLSPEEAHEAAVAGADYVDLRSIPGGAPWSAYLDDRGRLARFELTLAGHGALTLARWTEGWDGSWKDFARTTRVRAVRGSLSGSLEGSMARAGAPAELAYAVADVLQWDLDFSRDLRHGDEFRVLFEEVLVEGYEPRPERVLAVDYGRPGRRHIEAYWFADGEERGYYDADGRPLQKMFLRSPLPYSRITSRFSRHRFHPVLKTFRPHYGVDYGAPVGTPVRATASGTVVLAGWDGGGGKTVKIRHPNGYLSAYLHLSRFATGVRRGARIEQGEVIAFSGATGLASGPHLDYRVQKDGHWIDPLSIKSVPVEPVSSLRLAEFHAVQQAMRASLESGRPFAPPAVTVAREAARLAAAPPAPPAVARAN